jgi:uroporphyrinogen decarboxylase
MKRIVSSVRAVCGSIPIILFTKGGGLWIESMLTADVDCIGLDWTIDIARAKQIVSGRVSLQGNVDPCVLYGSETDIRNEVSRVLCAFGSESVGHVFNLGHGISQFTNPEAVTVLAKAVSEHSAQLRKPRQVR